jgi:uncharacterized membrane protein YhaH (DUF805 family)
MNSLAAFGIELLVTLPIGFLLVSYLRPSLCRVLVDLCGTDDRAEFWTAFTSVLLIALPTISALGYQPLSESLSDRYGGALLELSRQLSRNLMSLVVGLIGLGLIVSFFALVAPRAPKESSS